ncbi:hypothetical protein [Nocardia fluminea]|uniref:hypothetical protein n=1 Tax=Nocardia fluminea TaxID=134984 RepID=UPI0036525A92
MATGFEPNPGHEDLATATKDAEDAELAEALAEVRRRRAAAEGEPTPNDKLVAAIDPDNSKFEVDPDTGEIVRDSDGEPVVKWPHDTVTIKGHVIEIRAPKTTALTAFSLVNTKGVSADKQNAVMSQLLRNHISAKSFEELQDAMMDPDDEFEMDDFQELVKEIATRGTSRPTVPSTR